MAKERRGRRPLRGHFRRHRHESFDSQRDLGRFGHVSGAGHQCGGADREQCRDAQCGRRPFRSANHSATLQRDGEQRIQRQLHRAGCRQSAAERSMAKEHRRRDELQQHGPGQHGFAEHLYDSRRAGLRRGSVSSRRDEHPRLGHEHCGVAHGDRTEPLLCGSKRKDSWFIYHGHLGAAGAIHCRPGANRDQPRQRLHRPRQV